MAKKARDAASNDPSISDTLGWILFKKHQYRDAVALLRDSANKNTKDLDIQFHYGMAAYVTGDESAAKVALQTVANAGADTLSKTEARRRVDFLSAGTGEAGRDENKINDYLKDYPNDPVALSRLSEISLQRGDVDAAILGYEKILSNYEEFTPATRKLALLYLRQGTNAAKAMKVTTQARQSYPDDPEITKALGILNYKTENFPRAAELLKEATIKRPEDAASFYYLGKSYHELKQLGPCKAALERAVSLNLDTPLIEDAKSAVSDCTEPQQ
jgi:tetratricopeptide (TPR) repeat protein